MSYRLRVGSFPKKDYSKFKDKTYEELANKYEDPDYFNPANIKGFEEIEYVPSFKIYDDKKWQDFYSFNIKDYGYDFYILSKQDLLDMIGLLEKEVSDMYNDLYNDFENFDKDDNVKGKLASLVMSKRNDWDTTYCKTLILDEDKMCSTNSGSYEYLVFNLIAIYKMFKWEEDYLVLSGW